MSHWIPALAGGVMIGAASGLLLLAQGRIAGISGITASVLAEPERHDAWRWAFLAGLIVAGVAARLIAPAAIGAPPHALSVTIFAGLAVGFGTRLGGGCTSGHGVCGVARLSRRSLVAVAVFMITGIATATLAAVQS
jgi:uncharacterized membrane protein YedE/YeeE